jgi:hypothetical protein
MADLKISQLTSATTPLAGTEVLPVVQSSTTKQVSVANLTAGRAVSGLSFSAGTNIGLQNTSATAYSGVALNSNDSNTSTRNWAVVTSYNDYGDLCFVQSSTQGGSPVGGVVRGEFNKSTGDYKINTGSLLINTAGKGVTLPGGITWTSGSGSPESVVTAPVGSLYSRSDGGLLSSLYVKESGSGNTGWVGK